MGIVSSYVTENGQVTLPKPVRKVLGIPPRGSLVGFVIEGKQVKLMRAKVVPEIVLTDDEIALMVKWSKKGAGKTKTKNTKSALKYLWRL